MENTTPKKPNAKALLRLAAVSIASLAASAAFAQERPTLFLREDWKETPAALPVTQEHVANEGLTLYLHGPARDGIKKSHHDKPADDPYYIWSGNCLSGNWAVSLGYGDRAMDLSGLSKVRWRSKQSGFRQLHLIVKQASGEWLVADQGDGVSSDWRVREYNIKDLKWRRLNIETVTEEEPVLDNPDLTRIEQIGFTDLMLGGMSKASSRLDWIEVYCQESEAR